MKEVGVKIKVGTTGLEQIDKLTSELSAAGVSTTALDNKAAELAAELKRLGEQQALIDAFKRQKQAVDAAAATMQAAKAKASELGREISATEAPTKQQETAFARARTAARDASEAYTAQRVTLQTLRTSMASAGVSTEGLAESQRRVKAELAAAQANMRTTADWAQRLATAERAASTQATALAGASADSAFALRQTAAAAREAVNPLEGVGNTLRNVAAVGVAGILGSQTAQMLRSVAETADAYANLQARIKLVTGEGTAFTSAMEGIAAIALRTNSNLESTGNLFARLAQAGKEIGLGQEAALALTESVNQAVQLSGASATASDAAITQLVQGLQGGVLRGDEFNSVMEQAPRLAQALAAGLGVTTGELRKMAEAGQLSAGTVIRALQSQSAALQQEFGSLPATVGRAIENLSTRWKLFIGDLNAGTGATATVAGGINALADNLDELGSIATRAGAVLVAALAVQAVGALRSLAVQMAATGAGAALLSKNLNDIPKAVNIVVAVVGFEAAYQIGKVMAENFAAVRKLGVSTVALGAGLVETLRLLKEGVSALFTDKTLDSALEDYRTRIAAMRVIFQDMYADAEELPEVVRAKTAEAERAAKELGATATEAGAKVATAGAAGAAGLGSTTAAAETASGALQGLVSAATAANLAVAQVGADAARQAEALVKLALAGERAAETFRVELPAAIAKLSGPELEQFRVAMTQRLAEARGEALRLGEQLQAAGKDGSKAFAQAEQAARLLGQVAVDVGTRAAQALGVDLVDAGGRLSKEFSAAQDNLAQLIRSMPALKSAGLDASDAVARAITKMIDGARSQAEIDALVARLQALGKAGQISGDQVADGLDRAGKQANKLRQVLDDVLPGINSIDEAVRRLGIQTRTSLQATADDFAQAWARIQSSTDITLAEKIKAFGRFRDAAIAANDGVESSELALQRQTLQTKAEVAGLGGEFERAMGRADVALAKTKRLVNELGDEVNEAGERMNQAAGGFSDAIEQASRSKFAAEAQANTDQSRGFNYSADGFAQQNGQRFTASGQLTPPDDSGDWVFVGDVRTNNLNVPSGAVAVKGQGYWKRKGGSAATAALGAGGAPFATSGGGQPLGAGPAPTATPAPPSAQPATTRTLRLELGGGRIVNYQASSDAEVARVESLLRNLAAEAARAGP